MLLHFRLLNTLCGPMGGAFGGAAAFGFVGGSEGRASRFRQAFRRHLEVGHLICVGDAAKGHQGE